MARSQQENIINGNSPGDVERVDQLESQLGEKEKILQEMMAKFSRNRQILTSNWEQAETEVSLDRFSSSPEAYGIMSHEKRKIECCINSLSPLLQVRRLDDIYHTTVDRVVMNLAALPEVTKQHPALAQLLNNLQIEKVGDEREIGRGRGRT